MVMTIAIAIPDKPGTTEFVAVFGSHKLLPGSMCYPGEHDGRHSQPDLEHA
jgi:hypothetical protein